MILTKEWPPWFPDEIPKPSQPMPGRQQLKLQIG